MAGGLVTRTVTIISQGANGKTLSSTYVVTGNEETNLSQLIPISGATYAMEFAYATIQSVDIVSDQNITLTFHSSGGSIPAFTLVAGIPVHWDVDAKANNSTYFPNPFTADITSLVASANTIAANVNVSIMSTV